MNQVTVDHDRLFKELILNEKVMKVMNSYERRGYEIGYKLGIEEGKIAVAKKCSRRAWTLRKLLILQNFRSKKWSG